MLAKSKRKRAKYSHFELCGFTAEDLGCSRFVIFVSTEMVFECVRQVNCSVLCIPVY